MHVPRGLTGCTKPPCEQPKPVTESRPPPCSPVTVPCFSPLAPLVDLTPTHSGSAMLMLLSVVFVGLAVFVIYKFKRCVSPSTVPLPPSLLLPDRFRSPCGRDVHALCAAVMIFVNVLGRSRGLMFMPRCRMRKNERWSVESVTLKAGPMSLRLNSGGLAS